MNIRYLYGKEKILGPVIRDEAPIRLCDLTHYSRMENEKMRDNEMEKIFTPDRYQVAIKINGRTLNPDDMTADPMFTLSPRHCYCICLSNRQDEPELYAAFKADICIALDVDLLQERLSLLDHRFPGTEIKGKDVIYYHPGTAPDSFTPEELVFFKPNIFSHEAEYRIALFYPLNKTGFAYEGGVLPFKMEGESMFMDISHQQKGFISECVKKVMRRKSS